VIKKYKDGDLMDSFVIWMGFIKKNDRTHRLVAQKLFKTVKRDTFDDHYVKVVDEIETEDATGSKIWMVVGNVDNWTAEAALVAMARVPENKSWLKDWFK
jgi:hypothetical protein